MQRLQHTPCTAARLLFSARVDLHVVRVFHAAGGAMRTHARDDGFVGGNGSCDAGVTRTALSLQKCGDDDGRKKSWEAGETT
jgi:hypothetical protein